jgi:hypothetical protein
VCPSPAARRRGSGRFARTDAAGARGCVTMRRSFDRGIGFTLARVWWPGTLWLKHQIKGRGSVNYCPSMAPAPARR